MAVNWALADPRQGFDYLESLQALGRVRAQGFQNQAAQHKLLQLQRQEAALPGITSQVQQRDYSGAQAAAIGAGDFDLARTISGLSADDRKRWESEGEIIGRAASALKRVPLEQRGTVFRGMMPTLRQRGFSDDELRGVDDFSDDALDQHIALSTSISDQLRNAYQQARIDDIGLDNERSDRLADSTIAGREASTAQGWQRVGISREAMERTDARTIRGQNIASADRRRGQDMTDRRAREVPPRAGRRTAPGKIREGATATGPNGQKAVFRGGQWVPLR